MDLRIARQCELHVLVPQEGRYGIALKKNEYAGRSLEIRGVQPGSSADHAGLKKRDLIHRINNEMAGSLTTDEANHLIKTSAVSLELLIFRNRKDKSAR